MPKPLYGPSASLPAVHALAPSAATQAASAAGDQSNISHSNPSNFTRDNSVPASNPSEENHPDSPVIAPAPAADGKAAAPGLLPAASTPKAGAIGQDGAALGQNAAAPGQNPPVIGPSSPGSPEPLPGDARAAAAPGDPQTVLDKTHTNNLPVIVLGALLGVAIAALLAGRMLTKLDTALYCSYTLQTHAMYAGLNPGVPALA